MKLHKQVLKRGAFLFRFVLLTLALILCVACTACSSNSKSDSDTSVAVKSGSTSEDSQARDTGDKATPNQAEYESQETQKAESTSGSDSESVPVTPTITPDGAYLPDPGVFLSCGTTESGAIKKINGKGHYVSYDFDISAREVAEEYVALLLDSRFKLKKYNYSGMDSFSYEGTDYVSYRFDYIGSSPDVEEISDIGGKDYPGDVFLLINYYGNEGRVGLSLSYSDGFTLLDTGDRASVTPEDLSGNPVNGTGSSGSSPSYSSSGTQVKCYKCHGNKTIECSRCGGKGGKWIYDNSVPNYSGRSSTTSKTWERCSKCNGTGSMTCTACGGSGVR